MIFRFTLIACCIGMAIFPSAAEAQITLLQSTNEADKVKDAPAKETVGIGKMLVKKMTLTPAAEPRPALQYHLLSPREDRKPGNAVPFYYRAMVLYSQAPKEVHKTYIDNYDRWIKNSHDKTTREEMRKWVGGFHSALTQLDRATHREHCDWDLRLQDIRGVETIAFLLPEFQEMRGLARVLDVKLRVEIAEQRYDDALESLQMGYQLAHDTAKPPLLICGLVGVAISNMMNAQLAELIDSPDSPNLYWALAELPRPLVDLRPAMQHEMLLPTRIFPLLKDADKSAITSTRWRESFVDSVQEMSEIFGGQHISLNQSWKAELAATALVLRGYTQAKQQLIARGFDRNKVEAMSAAQVVAIEASHSYKYIYHEMFKWTHLPYWQAHRQMAQAEEKLLKEGYLTTGFSREILPFASLLMPAVQAASLAPIRNERELAALRTIEAIRMHAAVNGNRLPKSLQQIVVVPAPLNPMTGKPFQYQLKGDTAQLTLPPPLGHSSRNGVLYQIRIAPSKKK